MLNDSIVFERYQGGLVELQMLIRDMLWYRMLYDTLKIRARCRAICTLPKRFFKEHYANTCSTSIHLAWFLRIFGRKERRIVGK